MRWARSENVKEKEYLGDLGVEEVIILIELLKKKLEGVECVCLRIETNDYRLLMRY
jgi:hypothetical protein